MRLQDLGTRFADARANAALSRQVQRVEAWLRTLPSEPSLDPVVVFNASTRIQRLSLNAAYSLLAAWGLRAAGRPVIQAVCDRGLGQCPLGTERTNLEKGPPCKHCVRFSRGLFPPSGTEQLTLNDGLSRAVWDQTDNATLPELFQWKGAGLPLGDLVLPTVRWVLRRHDVMDDEPVRRLVRRYLAGAASLAGRLAELFERTRPSAVVLFNGILFPEAVARRVALDRGLRVVTHEVGLQPFSAFFSHEHATFRDVAPEEDRVLTEAEDRRLDAYLAERAEGRFSMAGIRFWPQIAPLPPELEARLANGRPAVAVFTNVVFDTSQVHAHTIYPSMFAWLEDLAGIIDKHPDRTFVLRAHPDEDRPGKESQQSVQAWVRETGLGRKPNVVFIPPEERVSSYELLRRAGLVLVYNSSIGLEAAIAGKAVVLAGRARYSSANAAYTPGSRPEYLRLVEQQLQSAAAEVDGEHARNARRFLHFELYRASLDFSPFLRERRGFPGMVEWTPFDPAELARWEPLRVVVRGVLEGTPFIASPVGTPTPE